jgi:hypothetical protein
MNILSRGDRQTPAIKGFGFVPFQRQPVADSMMRVRSSEAVGDCLVVMVVGSFS